MKWPPQALQNGKICGIGGVYPALINAPDLNLNFYAKHIDEKGTNGILADAL